MDAPAPKHLLRPAVHADGRTPWRLLGLLMTMTAIGSMSLNILVPAVPRLAELFSADVEIIQLTISLYIVGLALAQLLSGPLSDQFGRRPVILAGFALATCASLGAIVASNAGLLILMRLLQAIGGATGIAIGRAIIRDLFGRERSAQMLSLVASAMAVAPMVAPLIGGILDKWFGWQAIFLFAASASLLVFAWTATTLPETRPQRSEAQGGFFTDIRTLIFSGRYVGYVLSAALGCGAFFVFVGGGTHVVITVMHRSPTEYGAWFLMVSGGYILGNIITSRLSMRFGLDRMLWFGILVELAGAAIGIALMFAFDALGLLAVVAAPTLISVGNGMLLPNSIAGAVSVRPLAAGTASGLLGCTQMLFGAAMAQIAGHLAAGASSAWPIILQMALTTVGCALAYVVLLRKQN
jgi:DHA1 family bicyclomycin/chloramphenicol resistance-like MFS transporter